MTPISIQDIEAHRGAEKPAAIAKALGMSAQDYRALVARASFSESPVILGDQALARAALALLNPAAADAFASGETIVTKKSAPQQEAKPAAGKPKAAKQTKAKANGHAQPPEPAAAPDASRAANGDADNDFDEELAAREKQNSKKRGGKDNPFVGKTIDELLKALEQLAEPPLNQKGRKRARTPAEKRQAAAEARLIAFAAMGVPGGVSATLEAIFLSSIDAAIGCGKKQAKLVWTEVQADYARANQKTPEEIAAEQRAREEAEAAATALKLQMDIAALENKVGHIAKDPKLMENILDVLDARGVVGERAGKIGSYLTGTSRLTAAVRALCMLRRGPAASGKNHLIENVLELFPQEDIIKATGMSAKALVYYGGVDNPDAFKHKILYLAEAAAIAERNGQEHEATVMIRCVISEGYIRHLFVDADTRETIELFKRGPIAVEVTSARSNIEAELLTRLFINDADETTAQTRRIHAQLAARAEGRKKKAPKYSVEDLQDFQRLLSLKGPYSVVIPFASAMLAALGSGPTPLRARRDLGNIMEAVAASAIMHAFQRERDAEGAVIATLDDYGWAYAAMEEGLAAFYKPQASAPVVRLIEALERIKAGSNDEDKDGGFFAPYAQINKELGITSDDIVSKRLKEATSAKLIERVEPDRHFNDRAPPRAARYRILVASSVLNAETGAHVLPSREAIEEMLKDPKRIEAIIAQLEETAAKEQAQGAPKPADGKTEQPNAAADREAADRELARRAKAALSRLLLDRPETTEPTVKEWLEDNGLKTLGMAGAPHAKSLVDLIEMALIYAADYPADEVDVLKEFC